MTDWLSPRIVALVLVVLAALALAAAVAWSRAVTAPGLSNVDVRDLHAAAASGALVLDVREPHEYAGGHVAGSLSVPLATVASRAAEFDAAAPVYVFCRSGNRSLAAARTLIDAGFRDVRNVEGGIIAWQAAGLPVVR